MVWCNDCRPHSTVSQTIFSYCLKTLVGRNVSVRLINRPYITMHIDVWHCTNCSRSTVPLQNLPAGKSWMSKISHVWAANLNKTKHVPYPVLESSTAKAEVLPLKMPKVFVQSFQSAVSLWIYLRRECSTDRNVAQQTDGELNLTVPY